MNKLFILSSITIFLLISIVSANGLKVTQGNQTLDTLNQNKTFGINKQITFTITNEEAINFYNIGFSESSIISMTPINLSSGQNKTVTANIITNNDYNGILTLRGFYQNTIGASNITYPVNIDYSSGLDICNLEIIQGDTISWHNTFTDAVSIKNTDTGENIFTIPQGQTYNKTFPSAVTFHYQVTYLTLPFTQICTVTVQPKTGLVHSSNYDFKINSSIKINYEPTTIKTTFLTTNYTLNYNENTEDVFSIKNNGSKIAKNIHLESDWITFNDNDFDLSPGQQKNIGYTVQPQVFNTNDTNKTYKKSITITGNFPTINQTINILVPYANIFSGGYNGTVDPQTIRIIYNLYCSKYPSDPICALYSQNGTLSSSGVKIAITPELVNALLQKVSSQSADFDILSKKLLELQQNQTHTNQQIKQGQDNISQGLQDVRNSSQTSSETMRFVIVFILSFLIIVIGFLIYTKQKDWIKARAGFHKGEKP